MGLLSGIKFLLFAVLLFCISTSVCHTSEICYLRLMTQEISSKNGKVQAMNTTDNLKNGKVYLQWVCKGSNVKIAFIEAGYIQKDEEQKQRIRRGWGSRRRAGSWGSRRRSFTNSRRRNFGFIRRRSVGTSTRRRSASSTSRVGFWRRKPKTESEKKKTSKAWDKVHTALDIAGMVPGIGNVADGVNAGLHAARGNWKDAALSAAGMIPGAGQAATAAKIAKKTSKSIKVSAKAIKGPMKIVKKIPSTVKKIKRSKLIKKIKELKDYKDTFDSIKNGVQQFQEEPEFKPKDTGKSHVRTESGITG